MSIADIGALIVVSASAVYALGLVAIAWPIYEGIANKDITVTWYAVSLMPRTVVAGHGARIAVLAPVVFAVLFTVFVILILFYIAAAEALQNRFPVLLDVLLLLVIGLLMGAITKAILNLVRNLSLIQGPGAPTWFRMLMFNCAMLAFIFGFLPVVIGLGLFDPLGFSPVQEGFFEHLGDAWTSANSISVFMGCFLIALPHAMSVKAPLPRVELDIDNSQNQIRGQLIAHTDGYWHFFSENKRLTSILDEKVITVRLVEAPEGSEKETEGHTARNG